MLALCGSQGASISGALEGQERELIQLVSHCAFEGLWEVCAESVETNEPHSLPHRTHHRKSRHFPSPQTSSLLGRSDFKICSYGR